MSGPPLALALSRIGPGEFCALVASSAGIGQWYAMVADTGAPPDLAADLAEEIEGLLEGAEVLNFRLRGRDRAVAGASSDDPAGPADELVRGVVTSTAPVRIVSGFEHLAERDWAALNFMRSRLLGEHGLVFVLNQASLLQMQQHAPDIDSLLSAATWQLDAQADELSAQAKEARLVALRARFNQTDEEVVQHAGRAELPDDPAYAEWLVLLGKGDLLVRPA